MITTEISTQNTRTELPQHHLDDALIERARSGDHAAFEAIFTQYRTPIYHYIYRMMGSPEDAYDMTQDTFLKAYLALHKTSDDLRVGGWLYRIATNVCLDELRHRKLVKWHSLTEFQHDRNGETISYAQKSLSLGRVFIAQTTDYCTPEQVYQATETVEELRLLVEALPTQQRAVLILRDYHHRTLPEIADAVTLSVSAVKSMLFRARNALRARARKSAEGETA